MRLVAERLLPSACHGAVYVQDEGSHQTVAEIPLTNQRRFHLFCSSSCPGASALADEISKELGIQVVWTSQLSELSECEQFLLYLTRRTWTSGQASKAFAHEVCEAERLGVRLLLAHEFPSIVCDDAARGACPFGDFIHDSTPKHLLQGAAAVYTQIAIALKAGAWRRAGLVALAFKLAEGGGERAPVDLDEPSLAASERSFGKSMQSPYAGWRTKHMPPPITLSSSRVQGGHLEMMSRATLSSSSRILEMERP